MDQPVARIYKTEDLVIALGLLLLALRKQSHSVEATPK